MFDQVQSQLQLNRPVRDLCSWNGRKLFTMKNLIDLKEPAWATVGGEGFLAQGPLEWFRDRKTKLDKEIADSKEALDLIDQCEEQEAADSASTISKTSTASKSSNTNAYAKRLERHRDELKAERKVIVSRIRKLQDKAEREENLGSHHRMKNVQLIPTSDRIVGGLNMRLRIHENGSDKMLQGRV